MKDLDLCKLKLRYATLKAKHHAKQQMRQAAGCVKERPAICMSVALATGILIGKLLSRK